MLLEPPCREIAASRGDDVLDPAPDNDRDRRTICIYPNSRLAEPVQPVQGCFQPSLGNSRKRNKVFSEIHHPWRRLISISELERENNGLLDEQRQLKNSFVIARNADRDALLEALCATRLYFSEQVYATIKEFIRWDDLASIKTLEGLPSVSEWREWEEKIVLALQREISK